MNTTHLPDLDCLPASVLRAWYTETRFLPRSKALGMCGNHPCAETIVRVARAYALSKCRYIAYRLHGDNTKADEYDTHCRYLYEKIPSELRW
jgi:hypothetical protein